jgi:hypothetical protein
MMAIRLADLSPDVLGRARAMRWDRIIEKHEGPETWAYYIDDGDVEFMNVEGFDVLLPVEQENHANIEILRVIVSGDQNSLTIFLKDTTYETGMFAGFLAVCDRFPGQDWYLAIVYHEWFAPNDD